MFTDIFVNTAFVSFLQIIVFGTTIFLLQTLCLSIREDFGRWYAKLEI